MATERVFNLTKTDVTVDPRVIECTLLIQDIFMHALIDLGATHSFISYIAIDCAKLNTKELHEPMGVQSLRGISSLTHRVMPSAKSR